MGTQIGDKNKIPLRSNLRWIRWFILFQFSFGLAFIPYTPSSVWADSTNAPSLDDFDKICGSTLTTNSSKDQKLQYCQSAKSSIDGAQANDKVWKIWAAAASVCAAACAASFFIAVPPSVCIGTSVSAGVAQGVITKDYMSALTSVLMTGGSAAMGGALFKGSAAKGEAAAAPKKDIGACLAFLTATYQSYTSYQGKNSAEGSAKGSLASAANLDTSTTQTVGTAGGTNILGGDASSPNTAETQLDTQNSKAPGAVSTSAPTAAEASCGSSTSVGAMVSCAVASDKTIPSFVTTPNFADELQKSSGTSLGDFLSNASSPGQAIGAGMAGISSFSPEQAEKIASLIQTIGEQAYNDNTSMTYSVGRGGSHQSSSDSMNTNELIGSLLEKFLPKNGNPPEKTSGITQVIFANKNKPAALIAEDKTLSIFDRVSFRYFYAGPKVLSGGI